MTSSEASGKQPTRVQVKRYGSGKYYLYADAAPEHLNIVERAVIDAAKVCICFDDGIFRTALRGAGLPDPLIEQYLDSVSVIDDVFGVGKNPG
jgi:hypothetical protein